MVIVFQSKPSLLAGGVVAGPLENRSVLVNILTLFMMMNVGK